MSVKNDGRDREEKVVEEDELTIADPEPADIEAAGRNKIKGLRDKLKDCEKEKLAHLEGLQRAKADFLNARKRLEEEKLKDRERLIKDHIETLLPLCDSFHMAMADQEAWAEAPADWRKGVEGIYAQLRSILSALHTKPIDPVGQEFDPNEHEALSNVPVESSSDDHKVVSVIQLGYVREYDGQRQLIRPARVTVGEYSQDGSQEKDTNK